MKIGRSSIPLHVSTPYTRVGHCDDARWVSVSVLVSLMSHELAQSLKRITALWTNIRSLWCHIFALICRRRKQNWRTSQTKRWWCLNNSKRRTNAIHVQDAKILHEPIVKKPLPPPLLHHVQENGAIVKHCETIHIFLPLPSPLLSPPPSHMLIRVSCHSRQKWCPTRKRLHSQKKTRRSGATTEGDEREVPWHMVPGQGSPTPSFCRLCAFFLCHLPASY